MQVPVRVHELEVEKATYKADFDKAIGQLRYALNLQKARARKTAAASRPGSGGAEADAAAAQAADAAFVRELEAATKQSMQGNGAEPMAVDGPSSDVKPGLASPNENAADNGISAAGAATPRNHADLPHKRQALGENAANAAPVFPAADATGNTKAVPAGGSTTQQQAGKVQASAADALTDGMGLEHDADECPVCQDELLADCMMGTCGHCWCNDCHKKLAGMQGPFRCPLCQTGMRLKEVTNVSIAPAEEEPMEDDADGAGPSTGKSGFKVGGAYGTKVENVVATVRQILEDKPEDKVCEAETLLPKTRRRQLLLDHNSWICMSVACRVSSCRLLLATLESAAGSGLLSVG